ncbi:MAG: thioredoxin family protein [Ferruginibacter sp.]|nr:thioredoxin family protein [Ferruginibacter sp.]
MKLFFVVMATFISFASAAQNEGNKLYDPKADGAADIAVAIKKADAENKYVLIQAGGNWCGWCIEFARFCKADAKIDSVINNSFIWYHLNWSKENKNETLFAKYGYAQRFGFPVFIILNDKGERIHTQNSEYLEDGKKSYDQKKVLNFLQQWSPGALAPETYSK